MKKLLIVGLGIFCSTYTMDIHEKYKGKPTWTHFYIHDATRGTTIQKGSFVLIHHKNGKIDILQDKKIIYTFLNSTQHSLDAENLKRRIKLSFDSSDIHGCPNKNILIIDSI